MIYVPNTTIVYFSLTTFLPIFNRFCRKITNNFSATRRLGFTQEVETNGLETIEYRAAGILHQKRMRLSELQQLVPSGPTHLGRVVNRRGNNGEVNITLSQLFGWTLQQD